MKEKATTSQKKTTKTAGSTKRGRSAGTKKAPAKADEKKAKTTSTKRNTRSTKAAENKKSEEELKEKKTLKKVEGAGKADTIKKEAEKEQKVKNLEAEAKQVEAQKEAKKNKKSKKKKQKKEQLAYEEALKELQDYINPHVVMAGTKVLSGKKLLRLTHAVGGYPYDTKMALEDYEREKYFLQIELLKAQKWIKETGQRLVVLFEGRDAAGKGGTIKRIMEHLNPRSAHVVALEKPSEREQGEWYFQRYINKFPTQGESVFFDRSWYNRAGVERVMGFCSNQEYLEFLRQTPQLERMFVNSGIILLKYWFSVTRQEQLRRFHSRKFDPLKQWKLSPIDLQSLDKWDLYTEARKEMFFHTNTADSPWTVIRSDDKKRARVNCMRHLLTKLDYPEKDPSVVFEPDTNIVCSVESRYGDELEDERG